MEVWIETLPLLSLIVTCPVTSHVEVWIETVCKVTTFYLHKSPPTWRCGLKRSASEFYNLRTVTSHVEVWIETIVVIEVFSFKVVTSHVEVWIETRT